MTDELTVTVPGTPVGQGNIRHLGKGRPAVHQNAKTLKPWRASIAWHVRQEMAAQNAEPYPKGQPVALCATFTLPRPPSVPETARWAPTVAPDLDHYLRALGDALTGVLLHDDSQIVTVRVSKVYPSDGAVPGVTFTISAAVRGEQVAA